MKWALGSLTKLKRFIGEKNGFRKKFFLKKVTQTDTAAVARKEEKCS